MVLESEISLPIACFDDVDMQDVSTRNTPIRRFIKVV